MIHNLQLSLMVINSPQLSPMGPNGTQWPQLPLAPDNIHQFAQMIVYGLPLLQVVMNDIKLLIHPVLV